MIQLLRRAPATRWLLGGMAVSSLGTGLTLPFLVVYLHAVRGIPLPAAGGALASAGALGLLGALAGGRWVDRFGSGRMILFGLLLEAVGAAALAEVTTAVEATLVAAAIGAAEGMTWPALSSLVAVVVPERLRPRAFAAQFMLWNLGIGVGGLISGSMVSLHHASTFQLIYLADGVSFLLFAIVLGVGLRHFRGVGRAAAERAETARGSYLAVLRDRPFTLYLLCSLGFVLFGYAQVEAGFSVFAIEFVRVSPRVVGVAFAANCFVIAAAQTWVTRLTEARSRTMSLAAGALMVAVSWCLAGLADLPGLRLGAAAVFLVAAAAVLGVGETLVSPAASTLVNALASDRLRGRYNALAASVWGATGIIGPPLATSLLALGDPVLWIGPLVVGSLITAAGTVGLGRVIPRSANMSAA
ncbi:MAG: MFS transporter [Candidatus Dormibacteria bacterium]